MRKAISFEMPTPVFPIRAAMTAFFAPEVCLLMVMRTLPDRGRSGYPSHAIRRCSSPAAGLARSRGMHVYASTLRDFVIPDEILPRGDRRGVSLEEMHTVLDNPRTAITEGRPPHRIVLWREISGRRVSVVAAATRSWRRWVVVRAWREQGDR